MNLVLLLMTTILAVKKNGIVILVGDGQMTLGHVVMKSSAMKLRKIEKYGVVAGFAGTACDGIELFTRLESKLEKHPAQLIRSCVELSKEWRSDKALRKLDAMMLVADENNLLVITGGGEVVVPEYDVAAIGSGGTYAFSAALSLLRHTNFDAETIAREAMKIAADLCIYTNHNLSILRTGKSDAKPLDDQSAGRDPIHVAMPAVVFDTGGKESSPKLEGPEEKPTR